MVKGSCLCGAIEYQVALIEDKIFNCHCQFCRKAHGADYVTLALADNQSLNLKDEGNHLTEHINAIGGYRAFCGKCGTRLMNYAPDKNLYLSVTLSTIDSPINLHPAANVNTESKASWCELSDNIPNFKSLPDGII
ncbi:GFA family protein [Thalassotalea sp. G2M2-11]|uniref:GFA family protein n=1 Tax=Thalassotalea sp. G2M2-11 TaxID=2787627 RepID=UPI0019D084BA|nr:GFA family protein [Thalassotalea sp. G2M2-11]